MKRTVFFISIALICAMITGCKPQLLEQTEAVAFKHSFNAEGETIPVDVYVNGTQKPVYSGNVELAALTQEQKQNITDKFTSVSYSDDGTAIMGISVGVAYSQVKGVKDKNAAVSAAVDVLDSLGFSTQGCVALAENVGSQWGVEIYRAVDGIPVTRIVRTASVSNPVGLKRTTLRMYVGFDAEKGVVTGVLGQNVEIKDEQKTDSALISAQEAVEKYEEVIGGYLSYLNGGICVRLCYASVDGELIPVWRIQMGTSDSEELARDPDTIINAVTGELINY